MTIYSISDFSFNIGSTTISQQYVPLVNEDVPWGINSTYIYKAPTLRDQFNVINKHLVIENKCLSGNIIFKTQGTEKIIINDLSVGTINGLPYNGSGSGVGLTANSVNSSHIIDGSILGTDISGATITGSNIADGTITSSNILNGTILGTDISGATITGSNIALETITSANILNGTILETDISNNAITFDKLAVDSVGNTRIINGAVTHEKLSSYCVESDNIAGATITSSNIAGATIQGSNIASATIQGSNIAVGTITSSNIADGTILGTDISGATITGSKIASATIQGSNIAVGTITSSNIADGTILGTDISGATIQGSNIASATIQGSNIAVGTITSSNIADGTILGTDISGATITGSKIAVGTITSSNIADGTILGTDISNQTITGANIQDDTITQSKLAAAFLFRISNLEYPGFYGSLRIQNSNLSAAGTYITFTLQSTNIAGVLNLLGSTTLTPNQHVDVPILIKDRLLNQSTSIQMIYSSDSTTITPSVQTGVSVTTPIVSPNIYFSVLPAYIHNGTIQVSLTLAAPPPPVTPTITYTGTYDTGNWPNRVFNDTNTAPYGAPAGIYFSAEANMPLPLNLTFPAGSARVRLVTSPSVNWLSNLPDFIPTAGQTSANITINKVSPGLYDSQTTLQLLLNTNTNSSYNFLVTAHYEL